MGTPMATHLIAAGHTLFSHTRSKMPEAISSKASAYFSAKDVEKKLISPSFWC